MTAWLDLPTADGDHLPEQLALIREVKELLDGLGAPGLSREAAFPGRWDEILGGALLIVLPLAHAPHASIQLQMTATQILGAWDDKHCLWDSTPDGGEDLCVDGVDSQARAQVLAWLTREIERPFLRRDYAWGPLRRTTWSHTDGGKFCWIESRGPLLVQTCGHRCGEEPVGFLDPARVR